MFCGECGAQNPDTNQFCRNCGKPLIRHPAAVQPAAPSVPVPPAPVAAAAPAMQQVPQPALAAVPKRKRNWLGFLSIVFGVLSWGIMTVILAILAILLGIISLVLFRKSAGRIGISSVIGIILGIAAIAAFVMLA